MGRSVPGARDDIETNVGTDVEGPRATSLLSLTWSRDPSLQLPDREDTISAGLVAWYE